MRPVPNTLICESVSKVIKGSTLEFLYSKELKYCGIFLLVYCHHFLFRFLLMNPTIAKPLTGIPIPKAAFIFF